MFTSTGKERDSESGLDYFNARYFASALGRFTSPDPFNAGADLTSPQTWNAYAYFINNPLIANDPSGLDVTCENGQNVESDVSNAGGGHFVDIVAPCRGTSAASSSGPPGGDGGGGGTGPHFRAEGLANADIATVDTPAKNRTCPSVPQHPVNVSLKRNSFVGAVMAGLPPFVKEFAWYRLVGNKAPFDYKQQGKTLTDLGKIGPSLFQDFGNYNYGYVGAAAAFPLQELLRGAGAAQQLSGTSKSEYGTWLGGPPYGDDPDDQAFIRAGYQAFMSGCVP